MVFMYYKKNIRYITDESFRIEQTWKHFFEKFDKDNKIHKYLKKKVNYEDIKEIAYILQLNIQMHD